MISVYLTEQSYRGYLNLYIRPRSPHTIAEQADHVVQG